MEKQRADKLQRQLDELLEENKKLKGINKSQRRPSGMELEEMKEPAIIIPETVPIQQHQMKLRSQGQASTGSEIVQEIVNPQGQVIDTEIAYELAGEHYNSVEYATMLARRTDKGIVINKKSDRESVRNFKNAYIIKLKEDKIINQNDTISKQKFVNDAVNLLERDFKHDKKKVKESMKKIIDSKSNVILQEFIDKYNSYNVE
jgi:hypothetical protein